ncbi:MAG TPA: pantoate--beta-alanine ligase [Bryobacteraceae bacterium]|nr:pantoate--beta-alanine ligase [Bryobacteraceae bacterium]
MMRVWDTLAGWSERRRELEGRGIGFVPTMGALHRGHAALVERCRRENQTAVASIFVNPPQFNDPKDLERYPRTLAEDLALLEALGVDEVLAPPAAQLYPSGYRFRIEAQGADDLMEGACRPGFFQGVLTVVLKLLNLVRPARAYFGEKDFQQLRAVTEMVQEFFLPCEIVACPTVRAESGLAESSRNRLLSPAGRAKAAWLYRALTQAARPEESKALLQAEGFGVEYVEEHWGRRLAAVFLEGVRLIDNVPVAGGEA